jgi:hypothetical protein
VELTSGRACTCELDRVYCDRTSCLAAIKAENRRTNRDVRMDITRRLEGYVSRSHKMVLYCTDPSCPMRICVDIDRRDKSCAITTDSIDTHKEMCTSTAGSPTRQELLHNSDFVEAALLVISLKLAGGVHKSLNKLVKQYFNAEIKAGLCSELVQDLKDRFAFEGFREGFTGVRHILKEFCAVNPGSVYQLEVDLDDKFLSCSLIPANSLCIIQCSACTVVGMDASHTRVKTWGGNLFVLEAMDGNNCNVPIAIGIYAAENADNYTDFLNVIKSVGHGAMGPLLNNPNMVICSDRAKAFDPALKTEMPLARHRYDIWHIMQNMHNNGWKDVDSHMLACHKAVTQKEFQSHMNK